MAYHGHTGYSGWAHGGDGYHESYPSFHWRQDSASSRGWEESRTLLWVSCIPRTMRAAELGQVFQRFGPLVRVEIPAPKENGHKWVFGYVQFEQPQDAAIAIQRMHGAYIGSHSKIPLVVEYSINTSYLQSAEERRPHNASRGFATSSRRSEDRGGGANSSREGRRGRGRSRSPEPTDNYDYDYRRERSSKASLIHPDRQQRFRSRSRSPKARGPRRSGSSSSSARWGGRISATPSPSQCYQHKQQKQQRDSSQEALDRLRWTPSPVRGGSGERAGRGRREDTGPSESEIHEERAQQQQQPSRRSRWDENEQDWEQRQQREGDSMNGGERPKQQQRGAREQRRRPIDSPEPATGVVIRGSSSGGEASGKAGSSKKQKRFKREQGEGDGRCRL